MVNMQMMPPQPYYTATPLVPVPMSNSAPLPGAVSATHRNASRMASFRIRTAKQQQLQQQHQQQQVDSYFSPNFVSTTPTVRPRGLSGSSQPLAFPHSAPPGSTTSPAGSLISPVSPHNELASSSGSGALPVSTSQPEFGGEASTAAATAPAVGTGARFLAGLRKRSGSGNSGATAVAPLTSDSASDSSVSAPSKWTGSTWSKVVGRKSDKAESKA